MTRGEVELEFFQKAGGLDEHIVMMMADEIVRLREQLRDTHTKVFHLEEKLAWTERERDQLTSLPAERILAALREPSEAFINTVIRFGYSHFHGMPIQPANFLRAAVEAAEQETSTQSTND